MKRLSDMIVSCLRLFVVLVHITDVNASASVPTNNLDVDNQPVRDAVDAEDMVFDGLYFNAVMYVCMSQFSVTEFHSHTPHEI